MASFCLAYLFGIWYYFCQNFLMLCFFFIDPQNGWGKPGPTSRPAIFVFQNLASAAPGPEANLEKLKWLAGWLAHHIFGFPHPFWGYIIGIGIFLDIFPPQNTKPMNSDKNITIFRKGTRGKMTPQASSIQRQSPKTNFHEIYCC